MAKKIKSSFSTQKDKYIELTEKFETKGSAYNVVYKGGMPLGTHQKLKLSLMKDFIDPLNIDTTVLDSVLNEYFDIFIVDEDTDLEFEIADAILILNSFTAHVDKQRRNNKKK